MDLANDNQIKTHEGVETRVFVVEQHAQIRRFETEENNSIKICPDNDKQNIKDDGENGLENDIVTNETYVTPIQFDKHLATNATESSGPDSVLGWSRV